MITIQEITKKLEHLSYDKLLVVFEGDIILITFPFSDLI